MELDHPLASIYKRAEDSQELPLEDARVDKTGPLDPLPDAAGKDAQVVEEDPPPKQREPVDDSQDQRVDPPEDALDEKPEEEAERSQQTLNNSSMQVEGSAADREPACATPEAGLTPEVRSSKGPADAAEVVEKGDTSGGLQARIFERFCACFGQAGRADAHACGEEA